MIIQCKFQIGKSGLTDGVIESLALAFKKHKIVRISVLKSSGDERKNLKALAEEIIKRLGGNYNYKVIGFTIVMRRFAQTKDL